MKNIDARESGGKGRFVSVIGTIAVMAVIAVALGIVIIVHNSNQPTVASPRPASTGSPTAAPGETSSAPAATPTTRATTPAAKDKGSWKPRPTKKPAEINKQSETGPGLVFEVAGMKAVKGQAKLPGDVAGPAIRFTVKVTNTGDRAADLSTTVVSVFYGQDKTPALQLNRPASAPFPETLKPDKSAHGQFEFTVPDDERDRVLITVDHSVDSSIVAFEGSAPK